MSKIIFSIQATKSFFYFEAKYPQVRKLKNIELSRITIPEFKQADKTPFVIVLDNIRSLNNIGSIFRTADAFVMQRIVLCGITATPPQAEIQKTALGATESVNWWYREDSLEAVQELKEAGYSLIGIEQTEGSISLPDFRLKPQQSYAFIFGNEVKGVRQDVIDACDACIEIPQFGTKHSLNISISAGIVMWDLFRQFRGI